MKKNSYIKDIVEQYFHHTFSEDIVRRVRKRMINPVLDKERDEALKCQWMQFDSASVSEEELEDAFRQLEASRLSRGPVALKKRSVALRWVAAALIPLLFMGSLFITYYLTKVQVAEEFSQISLVEHCTKLGEKEEICLPDGTRVWLNAGSTLVYPSSFSAGKRTVFLAGEAFFEVQKDPEHPFEVNTHYLDFRVLGTSFNISSYQEDSQVVATLETGKLEVRVKEDARVYHLLPNQQLWYSPATKVVLHQEATAQEFSKWRQGHIQFTDMPFGDILRSLERIYGVKFFCETPRFQQQKLRLYLNSDESLENALKIMQLILPDFHYAIVGNTVYIR